jgi:cell division protein ZapA
VDARLRELSPPGRQIPPQALVLAAIALAHDLEEERARRASIEERSKQMLSSLLTRIDTALSEPEPAEESDSEADSGPDSDQTLSPE